MNAPAEVPAKFTEVFSTYEEQRIRAAATRSARDALLDRYRNYTVLAAEETVHQEYCVLQASWNQEVLDLSSRFLLDGSTGRDRMLSLGSFLGLLEMTYASVFKEVVCVDQDDFIVSFRPENLAFHRADLDTSDWQLPGGGFDVCFMVEILEHLLWSPVPLLKWIHANCSMLVITTPDDAEWPAMDIRPYTRYQHFSAIPGATPGVSGNPVPMSHCKQYSQAEFVEMLDFCGFALVELRRIGVGAHQMIAICKPRGR